MQGVVPLDFFSIKFSISDRIRQYLFVKYGLVYQSEVTMTVPLSNLEEADRQRFVTKLRVFGYDYHGVRFSTDLSEPPRLRVPYGIEKQSVVDEVKNKFVEKTFATYRLWELDNREYLEANLRSGEGPRLAADTRYSTFDEFEILTQWEADYDAAVRRLPMGAIL